jgi:hypothetical protein
MSQPFSQTVSVLLRTGERERSVASASMISSTFAERFCTHFRVHPADYREAVMRRVLHRRARLVRPLLRLASPDYFAADYDFIEGVGRIAQRREFGIEAEEFAHHPANRGFWRRALRLRASVGRMQRLVNEVFGDPSSHPFPKPGSPTPF